MKKTGSSRLFLIIGVLALALFAAQNLPRLIPTKFEFEDIPTMPGYRMLVSGEVSGSINPFVGLDDPDTQVPARIRSLVAANTCAAHTDTPVNEAPGHAVPISYFTDVQCPNCRILSGTLSDLVHRTEMPIQLTLREFPVFGEWSEMAAAASLAAGLQGAHLPFHERLMSVPLRPSKAAINSIVAELGLDETTFWNDFGSPRSREELARHRATGDLFGVYGTPAMVIGRTLVIGKIAAKDLDRLIEIERDEVERNPCKDYEPN